MRIATRFQLIGLALAIGLVATSWGALFYFGLGWGRQDIVFEANSPMCRNIPVRVDGQLWHSPDGAVPYDIDQYELSFDAADETGVLVLRSRVDQSEVRLTYRGRGEIVPLPCLSS